MFIPWWLLPLLGFVFHRWGWGLATLIGRKNFSAEERETGKAALVMGCVGVTEGAIPFAAADPLRVIPSIMVGSVCGAVTAALVGAQCYAAGVV